MKSAPLVAAVAFAGAAIAIDRNDYLPECSVKCLDDATTKSTDCSLDDAVCWCVQSNYEAIYNTGVSCVLQECGLDKATGEVLPAAARFCLDASSSASAAEKTPAPTAQATSGGSNTAAVTDGPSSTPAASGTGAGGDVKATSSPGGAAPTAGPAVGAVLFMAGALAAL
ncbi:hypothetical protein K4F52_001450 [Lecanicillium sp. MT-2017a]|nr:hypothetical protein K4F52_001450 [Lecanicillium sp. MT-2017a]